MAHNPKHALRISALLGMIVVAVSLTFLITSCSSDDETPQGPSISTPIATPFLASTPTPTPTPAPTPTPTPTPSPQQELTDRDVLVALYHATGGPNWKNNTNWLTDKPLGEWRGVTTNENGRVAKLSLFRNRMSGEMPPDLGCLSQLKRLDLSYNHLTGLIPPELGNLFDLEFLHLANNQLIGVIPQELSKLSNLERLTLESNQLSGNIPPELGNLTNLLNLRLDYNQLTGTIPPELANLSRLTNLRVSANSLTGCIPESLWPIPEHDLPSLNLPFCP